MMDSLNRYQAKELLEFANLVKKCGGSISSKELMRMASNVMDKNIKIASKNELSNLAQKELLEINKNALSEISRYSNDLANDYFVLKASNDKVVLGDVNGNRVIYSVPLLNFAKKSFDFSGIAGFLSGVGKGGILGGIGKGAALQSLSKLLDDFAKSENFDSVKGAINAAKQFLSSHFKEILMIFVGVAVYAMKVKNKPRFQDAEGKMTWEGVGSPGDRGAAFKRLGPSPSVALSLFDNDRQISPPLALAATNEKIRKDAVKSIANMCKLANSLDELGEHRTAMLLDSASRTLLKFAQNETIVKNALTKVDNLYLVRSKPEEGVNWNKGYIKLPRGTGLFVTNVKPITHTDKNGISVTYVYVIVKSTYQKGWVDSSGITITGNYKDYYAKPAKPPETAPPQENKPYNP